MLTNVARSADGDEEWCGHWHEDGDEANECPWHPSDPDWQIFIIHQDRFEPFTKCVHELHPAECLRCLSLECIHLNNPQECERCVLLSQTSASDVSGTPEVQEGSSGPEGLDPEGGGHQRLVSSEGEA